MSDDPPADAIPHVVIVDDNPAIRDTLKECLLAGGYRVTEAGGRAELIAAMDGDHVDLITIDLRLGAEDGLDLTQEVRTRSQVPIIMISGVADPLDRARGLELGADDYITKPFNVRELLARVGVVLRRAQAGAKAYQQSVAQAAAQAAAPSAPMPRPAPVAGPGIVTFDDWTLDCRRRRLLSPENRSCVLTATEFDLLRMFLQNPNRVLSRDMIMDLLKGPDWTANDRVIDNQVRRLRNRMNDIDGVNDMIQSIRGGGYMLAADVAGQCDLPALPGQGRDNGQEGGAERR
ncbi:response regulator transcription factor [Acidimangrovimonas sediminis]|uniref:response regulator transcription factor n=1 Tax=Acidimangrovimonas sediminis TaxID=2056283 RepID=UPI000C7FD810|nr:response regulator transcription factor [Acidimangrovimonas sediminis]